MARPIIHDGRLYKRGGSKVWWIQYRDRNGVRRRESTGYEDWQKAQKCLRDQLQARNDNRLAAVRRGGTITFDQWANLYLEDFSRPPYRAPKTHAANQRAIKHLKASFGNMPLVDLAAEEIEQYLRNRLKERVVVRTKGGNITKELVKPSTVHQEFRVLRRMLNVGVRKKLLGANPCAGVEFPARLTGSFRPHYTSWSEQQLIEVHAPTYLRNVIRIITETGQIDLLNGVAWIADSKTPNGVAEVPLTAIAREAFASQMQIAGPTLFLFPGKNADSHQKSFKKVWRLAPQTGERSVLSDLRSSLHLCHKTQCGRRNDEWVTQLLRQGDAKVFKKYSHMKLQMKREALAEINRQANEEGFDTARST